MPRKTRAIPAVLAILLASCSGVIADPAGGPGASGRRGSTTDPSGTGEACTEPDAILAGPAQLRRLTQTEYDNTVRDLLGDDSRPAHRFGSDGHETGFAVNANASVTRAQLEAFVEVSAELAARALATHGDEWLPCDRADRACVEGFIESFGLRAHRRPLEAAEVDEMLAFYETSAASWGTDRAIEMLIEAMLLSPELLYHVELGTPAGETGVVRLDAWEIASALSYFLWSTMPDDTLFAAAAAGELDTLGDIEAHARRMIDDPRGDATLESFFTQWLEVSRDVERDPALFPEWDADTSAMLHDEIVAFTRSALREGDGSLHTLLTGSFSVGGPELAAWYGAPPPDGTGRIELDPNERAGVLTRAGVLASHAYPGENAWVQRGKFIRERFLCDPIPPPPPDVDMSVVNNPNRLTDSECAFCHLKMDPIGMGFDDYDPTGAFDPSDEPPHEMRGMIHGAEALGVADHFDDPVELAHTLAESEQVSECFARQWLRFAMQRHETAAERCAIESLRETFDATGGDVRELLVAIVTAEAFMHRRIGEEE